MKKYISYLLGLTLGLNTSQALAYTDADVYRQVYKLINENYIKKADNQKLMIESLKALNTIDKNLTVADDSKRVSLYYKGKIIKSYLKPKAQNKEIDVYVDFMEKITQEAKNISKEVERKDFELADILLEQGVKNSLDGYSKYYPMMAEEKGKFRHPYLASMRGDILYVRMLSFNKYSLKNLKETIQNHSDNVGMILDLRGSEGGSLSEALKVADVFLDSGIIIVSQDKHGNNEFFEAKENGEYEEKPLVILVDENTASSAEVLAMSVQSQSRGKVVGTQTFGKGSRQQLYQLENNSELGITTGYFYSGEGVALNGLGVLPDVCTRGLNQVGNMDTYLESQKRKKCPKEDRAGQEFDIEIAEHIIKSEI